MSRKASPLSVGTKIKAKTATLETANHTRTTTTGAADISPSSGLNTVPGDISTTTAMQAVKIKKELPSDEIKEFAENTMNELLGWYGFDGVDRLDLSTKTSRLLQSAAVAQANNAALTAANSNNNASTMSQQQQRHCMEKRRSRSRAATLLQLQQQQNEHMRNMNNNNSNNSSSNNNANNKSGSSSRKMTLNCGGGNYRGSNRGSAGVLSGVSDGGGAGAGTGGGGESTTSDHDTRSSHEEDSKSPISAGKNTTLEEKIDLLNCCWCRRPVPENAPEFLTTSDGPRYCSESCFTQSRRASFKKAKTCDWCKHVRHAISYVDFQDGASQLQFCSDKCLNQYKMQIFCKETQAHLDMNPHLREQGLEAVASGNGAGLITPDLWLRNCRSRSASPASTISVSPGPQGVSVVTTQNVGGIATGSSSSPASSAASNVGQATVPPHKPMISVAPVSKLMSKSVGMLSSTSMPASNRVSPKHNRKKRPLRSSLVGSANAHAELSTACIKGNHMTRDGSGLSGSTATNASNLLGKGKSMLTVTGNNSLRTSPGAHLPVAGAGGSCGKPAASVLNQFAGSSVQDLHMSVPPLSPMMEQQTPSHVLPTHPRCGTSIPPAFFATTTGGQPPNSAGPHSQIPHGAFPSHPSPFLPNAGAATAPGLPPRFFGGGGFPTFPLPPHVVQTPPDVMGGLGLGALLGAPPPVTVMVPYPIVIPLPIPIPVPLPVMDFCKAYMTPEERSQLQKKEASEVKKDILRRSAADKEADAEAALENSDCEQKIEVGEETICEEPLDFTKTKNGANAKDIEDQNVEICPVSAHSADEAAPSLKRALSNEHLAATTTLSPATPITPTTNTTTTTAVTPSPDRSPCSPETSCKATHCIVRSDESETVGPGELCADVGEASAAVGECDDAKQKLPKFKITRLQTKRTLIQTKESSCTPTTAAAECSRPLRKRKRLIDCDFQNLALKELASADGDDEENSDIHNDDAVAKTTVTSVTTIACNNNTKAQSKK